MKNIVLFWFVMMSILSCNAQERIRLTTGNTIHDATLYKEHDSHITYLRKNSLHDLEKKKIEFIETDSTILEFKENGKLNLTWKIISSAHFELDQREGIDSTQVASQLINETSETLNDVEITARETRLRDDNGGIEMEASMPTAPLIEDAGVNLNSVGKEVIKNIARVTAGTIVFFLALLAISG